MTMKKSRLKRIFSPVFTTGIIIAVIMIYIVNGTMLLIPKTDYVRLKSGKEFRNTKVARRSGGSSYEINGTFYSITQIDSISDNSITKYMPAWMKR